jgi:hypothetical protein
VELTHVKAQVVALGEMGAGAQAVAVQHLVELTHMERQVVAQSEVGAGAQAVGLRHPVEPTHRQAGVVAKAEVDLTTYRFITTSMYSTQTNCGV